MRDDDIVDDILSRVKNILGDKFSGDIVIKLEKEEENIRRYWGGCESYVRKRTDQSKARIIVKNERERGVSVAEIASNTGISRTQVYRLIKMKVPK